ncbi:MAG: ATP-binding cassette domain-containing protein [Lachnospiraceae bacterium]|nr:ATP-binding cassette domain-containing protein [Lachnospiraceae bacterium]
MIQIENLCKKFGEATVLDSVSMTLEPGRVYGLVGRNGSGKTMLLKHILGFVKPTSGTIRIDGKEIGKDIDMPQNVGAIIENPGFLPEYSAFKNLKFLAMIRGKISDQEIKDAIRLVGLDPESRKHVGKFSLGMRQRLGIAQALMENPDILLLDEPLSGLDNDGVEEMHHVLIGQKEQGKLLIIASHSKEDIEVLCDEVFRFDKGKIIGHEVTECEKQGAL